MNTTWMARALAASCALALFACIGSTSEQPAKRSKTAGQGGDEQSTSETTTVTTTTTGVGGSGSGTCNADATCGDFLNGSVAPESLCDSHLGLYQSLVECVCSATCAPYCAAPGDACSGGSESANCAACVGDPSGCLAQITACQNDVGGSSASTSVSSGSSSGDPGACVPLMQTGCSSANYCCSGTCRLSDGLCCIAKSMPCTSDSDCCPGEGLQCLYAVPNDPSQGSFCNNP